MTEIKKTDVLNHDHRRARRPNTSLPLRRSKHKMIAGIASGIASYINANPFYIRLIFFILLILTAGIVILPYLILWWLIPLEP
jgi:phage shock protein PspC (stress-responsive transcriptional regulator)